MLKETSNQLDIRTIPMKASIATSVANGFSLETVKDVPKISSLREEWQSMTYDPNGDIDFYLTFLDVHRRDTSPYVIVLRKEGRVEAILAGRIELRPIDVPLGYRKLKTPPVRVLTLVHGGMLGEDREDFAVQLVSEVWNSLKRNDADVACFHGIDNSSSLYRVAKKMGSRLTRDFFPVSLPRLRLKLAPTYEEVVQRRSANTRHNLKRYSKRFEKTYAGQIEIRTFRDPHELDSMMADTEIIAKETYVRGLQAGFAVDEQTQRLAALTAEKGWLRAQILYLNGEPCAFWNGFLYKRTFFTWTTGYLAHLSEFRPGMYLLQKMLEDLCKEGGVDDVDFGFGDAQYKRDLCDFKRMQESVLLFAPNTRGIAINLVRTPLMYGTQLARTALVRTGFEQKIKKLWRRRVAETAANAKAK